MRPLPQILRTALLTVAWLVVIPCLCVLLSAIAPVVPWVRVYLVDIVPNRAAWILLTCLALLGVGLWIHRDRKSALSRALVMTAALVVALSAWVIAHLLYVAIHNGARIDPLETLSWRHYGEDAGPDESRIYSSPGGEALWLDVYHGQPTQPGARPPVMMFIHGGGFSRGSRTFGAANLRHYAEQGWTVISIDYRLARDDRPTWNLAGRDVECALAWTAAHADALRIDIRQLVLNGVSAGASLALGAAYAGPNDRIDPECGPRVPRAAGVIAKVPLIDAAGSWRMPRELQHVQQTVLSRYIGGSPDRYPQRYAALNPTRYLGTDVPPTLIMGGSDDPLVPPQGAAEFVRKAKVAGKDVRYILFPYSGHEFNSTFGSIPNQALRQFVMQFMREQDRKAATR